MIVLIFIYGIFILTFFANTLVQLNLIPNYMTLAVEGFVYVLFIYSLLVSSFSNRPYKFHLVWIFITFLIFVLCSMALNGSFNFRVISFLRPILRFYIFYLALINLNLSDSQLKHINILLLLILVLQPVTSAFKFGTMGISEQTIGTYGTHGGGVTPFIAIVPLAYLAGYYALYKPKIIYILFSLGFIFFGIAGAKRVLFVLFPLSFIAIYLLVWGVGKKTSLLKIIPSLIFIICMAIGLSAFIISANRELNPEGKQFGSVDFNYALNYADKYEKNRSKEVSYGRMGTIALTFETMYKYGLGTIVFGFGPGSYTFSALDNVKQIDARLVGIKSSYGMTGMAQIALEAGIFGLCSMLFIFLSFLTFIFRFFLREKDPYWKAFAAGSVFFILFNTYSFLIYNTAAVTGDIVPPVFYYTMAACFISANNHVKGYQEAIPA